MGLRRFLIPRILTASYILMILLVFVTFLSPNISADYGWNISNVYHSPDEPFAGMTVSIYAELENDAGVSETHVQYCTVDPKSLEVISCYFLEMDDLGNRTFLGDITKPFDGGTMIGYRIIVQYVNETLEYAPGEHEYYYYNYTGGPIKAKPTGMTTDLIIAEVVLGLCIATLVSLLVYRRMKKIRTGTDKILVIGIVLFLIIGVLYAGISLSGLSPTTAKVQDFSLTDIDGNPWNLSDHSGKVVVLDFMATTCIGCEALRQSLVVALNDFGEDEVEVISIAVGPDTDTVLREYRDARQVNWTIARDTEDLVSVFGVSRLPKLIIIDRDGYATYEVFEDPGSVELRREIDSALKGTAQPISVYTISIFATAAFMGIATYFSPCSFPMLPGFVTYYLSTEAQERRKSLRTVLASGFVSGLGIVLVFLVIGLVTISVGSAAHLESYIDLLGPIVGIILVDLGILMFTELQYHALIRPFQKLREMVFRKRSSDSDSRFGYYTKLFSYGVGYGAAASACTAPLLLALLLTGLITGSFLEGAIILTIFSVTIILLMVAITLMLSAFGQESVQKLSAHTDKIKKISGAVLVIVGIYLYLYYITTFAS
ncbi:MAG: cytochrome c biogenesis protein CcdA [Thermoplasmata archaeon]